MSLKKFFSFSLIISSLILTSTAFALEYKVAAIVNGKAISNVQVMERVDIIMDSTSMERTTANRLKVTEETIEILINETLQAQEAKDKGVSLSEREINASIEDLERSNNMEAGKFKGFIKSRNLSYQAAIDQIEAGLLWKKTVSRFLRPKVSASKKEIKKQQAKLAGIKRQKLYSISEIILPIDPDNRGTSELVANKIVTDARENGGFANLAKKYSAGRTGKQGGFVGYIPADKVVEPLSSMILNTAEGGISEPKIVEDAMYVIIRVNEIKELGPKTDDRSIEEQVLLKKLEKESKKYIKKLRQKAFIEKKFDSLEELL